MIVHDCIANGQSRPGALPRRLGGEKGFADLRDRPSSARAMKDGPSRPKTEVSPSTTLGARASRPSTSGRGGSERASISSRRDTRSPVQGRPPPTIGQADRMNHTQPPRSRFRLSRPVVCAVGLSSEPTRGDPSGSGPEDRYFERRPVTAIGRWNDRCNYAVGAMIAWRISAFSRLSPRFSSTCDHRITPALSIRK